MNTSFKIGNSITGLPETDKVIIKYFLTINLAERDVAKLSFQNLKNFSSIALTCRACYKASLDSCLEVFKMPLKDRFIEYCIVEHIMKIHRGLSIPLDICISDRESLLNQARTYQNPQGLKITDMLKDFELFDGFIKQELGNNLIKNEIFKIVSFCLDSFGTNIHLLYHLLSSVTSPRYSQQKDFLKVIQQYHNTFSDSAKTHPCEYFEKIALRTASPISPIKSIPNDQSVYKKALHCFFLIILLIGIYQGMK